MRVNGPPQRPTSRAARRHPNTIVLSLAATLLLLGAGVLVAGTGGARQPPSPTDTRPATAPAQSSASLSPSAAPKSPPAAVTSRQPRPVTSRPTTASRAPQTVPAAQPGTALAALKALPVKGRAPRTGYDRERFGSAWADVDRNGCDTRNDVLRRDLTSFVLKAGTHGCLVLRGTLHDPYTGRTISFLRGQSTSMEVQVDHVVALSDAWQKGAQSWDAGRRERFANDSLNLLAVDGPTNARKGDGDAATWLPPSTSYRCDYVARQVAVKHEYGLWMTRAEQTSAARVLSRCPSRPLPRATAFVLGGGRVETAVSTPQPTPPPTHQPEAPAASGTDPDMGTCKAAKAAGYGPYFSGRDGEYGWYRDQDGDGVVCE